VIRRASVAWVLAVSLLLPSLAASSGGPAGDGIETPASYRRAPDQTFLTFPEWFLVYSPAEYADYVQRHTPTRFPFLRHIGQFWRGYGAVIEATRHASFNFGYHLMIVVIGVSTTGEYLVRSVYENTVGRLTEISAGGSLTEEDRFGAGVARDYVDFIRVRPWYEYDFFGKLERLWSETPLTGNHPLRKWERRYALTSEYLGKAIYGWLIHRAARLTYEEESEVTAVRIEGLGDRRPTLPKWKVLTPLPDGSVLATVPRYQAFTDYALALADEGVTFREIAGNRGEILVSVLAPPRAKADVDGARWLLTQPVITRPSRERRLYVTTVPRLSATLGALRREACEIEHIYDY